LFGQHAPAAQWPCAFVIFFKIFLKVYRAGGDWELVRYDLSDLSVARDIARASLEPSGTAIWLRSESEPDSAIRRF
jgi:hypothetical protein